MIPHGTGNTHNENAAGSNAAAGTVAPKTWQALVDVLRQELEAYGGFLGLLTEQQKSILEQNADRLRGLEDEIAAQIKFNEGLRTQRLQMVAGIAGSLGQQVNVALSDLLPSFPQAAQPLLRALVDEINSLIGKARKLLKQNHLLLARAQRVTEEIITALNPQGSIKTYSQRGSVQVKTSALGSRLRTSA